MTRLILHVGTHKTGTTSIQKALGDNRDWLRKQGVTYPDGGPLFPGRSHHHRWSRALTGAAGQDRAKSVEYLNYVDSIRGDRVVISTEAIYKHIAGFTGFDIFQRPDYWERRQRYIKDLAALVSRYEVQIFIWFREKESFARSLFAEMVTQGHWQGPFDAFREVYAVWFEYERQLDLFEKAFPLVNVFSYDEDCRNGLVPAFFSRIGVPTPPGAAKVWERRTDYEAINIKSTNGFE